jgi:RNA polymerase sigma factor (sigma-70 family)
MSLDPGFADLMWQVRAGDVAAETALFRQYVRRLIALAARQFDGRLRERADIENVVLSACKSFFLRHRRGEFHLEDGGELWTVLAMITLRKCDDRRRYLRAARRDSARDIDWPSRQKDLSSFLDESPAPEDQAIFTDLVEQLRLAMSPEDWTIIEELLIGFTAEEIAQRLDCSERTVRRVRQRAKSCLRRLMTAEAVDAEQR